MRSLWSSFTWIYRVSCSDADRTTHNRSVQWSAVLYEQATELSRVQRHVDLKGWDVVSAAAAADLSQLMLLWWSVITRYPLPRPASRVGLTADKLLMAYASLLRAAAAVTDTFLNSLRVFIVVGFRCVYHVTLPSDWQLNLLRCLLTSLSYIVLPTMGSFTNKMPLKLVDILKRNFALLYVWVWKNIKVLGI